MKLLLMPIATAGGPVLFTVPLGYRIRIQTVTGSWSVGTKGDIIYLECYQGSLLTKAVWRTATNGLAPAGNGLFGFARNLSPNTPLNTDQTVASGVLNYAPMSYVTTSLPDVWMEANIILAIGASPGATAPVFESIQYELALVNKQ